MSTILVEVKEEQILLDKDGRGTHAFTPRHELSFGIETDLISAGIGVARAAFAERHGDRYQILSVAPSSKEKISFLIRPRGAPTTVRPSGFVHKAPPKTSFRKK
jgi:hypothetical protein